MATNNTNSNQSDLNLSLNKSLNSATLSKALTKPPPLSSLLTNVPKNLNGSLSTANSSLSPSPSILQQQSQQTQPLIGSNLIAQSKKSTELLNQSQNGSINSLNNSISSSSLLISNNNLQNEQLLNKNLNNSLPTTSTAQLFNSNQSANSNLLNQSSLPNINQNLNQNNLYNNQHHQQQQQQSQTQFINNSNSSLPQTSNSFQNLNTSKPLGPPLTGQSQFLNQFPNVQQAPILGPPSSNGPSQFANQQTTQSLGPPPTGLSQFLGSANLLSQNQYQQPVNTQPTFNQPQLGPPPLGQYYQQNTTQPPVGPPTIRQIQPNGTNQFQQGPPSVGNNFIGPPPTAPSQFSPVNQQQQQFQPPKPGFPLSGPPQTTQVYQNGPSSLGQLPLQTTSGPSLIGAPPIGPSLIGPPPTIPTQFNQTQLNYSQNQQTGQIRPPPNVNDLKQQLQEQQIQRPGSVNSQPLIQQFNKMNLNNSNINTTISNTNNINLNNSQARTQPNAIDLLREKKLLQAYVDESTDIPRPLFPHEFYTNVNCHSDTIRCTLTSIPESQNLLNKSRLPLGILIHPFKDLESLKVVQSSIIVRCRNCRSYINPFVHFLDNSKWRCNLCYSINDLPEEFLFDPVTRTYGDPSKRPEINSATIEFIAPPEYTLRPPPPAMYLYLLDVSHNAINTCYLQNFCETLIDNLDKLPGDSRAQIGFITYNSSVHFYNLSDSLSQPKMMIYPDLEDLCLPMPDTLMVNLNENRETIQNFLQTLPNMFADVYETDSALGTALNAGYQLLKQTGGRITIMQTCLPNIGVGALKQREDSIDKDSSNIAPQTDFYKKLALDCAGVQIAVDLFMLNSLNSDLATLSCVSKYSGGEIKYYPGFHPEHRPEQVLRFCSDFKRYLTRKIGFEAVMRIRCTRGLAIHTFHGNFFVRSTDLLALPNVNPDAGFGMQVNIEESLTDISNICFQAAVLYTSSKSERRIRIHTYSLPVTKSINEIVNGADQEAIIGLISKMAADRTSLNSLKEARDAMVNVAIDYLQAYSQHVTSNRNASLISPYSLRLVPMYVLALMKNTAFKFGNVKMDDRVYAMNLCKTMPLKYLMLTIYPNLYAIHNLDDTKVITDSYETDIYIPPRIQLSSENIDRHGVYLMDCGESIYMWIGRSVSDLYLQQVFDVKSFGALSDHLNDLPELENELSEKIRNFLAYLYDSRPFGITFLCFKEGSQYSSLFFQHLHDDKSENSVSYYEFLRHLNDQING